MEHLIKETGGLLKEGRSAGWWGLGGVREVKGESGTSSRYWAPSIVVRCNRTWSCFSTRYSWDLLQIVWVDGTVLPFVSSIPDHC